MKDIILNLCKLDIRKMGNEKCDIVKILFADNMLFIAEAEAKFQHQLQYTYRK